MHIAECTAFDLEHPVRREVTQPAVQTAERITEWCGLEVDGDVGFRLDAEEWGEPSQTDGMPGKSLQRMAAEHVVAVDDVVSMLGPGDCVVGAEPVGDRRDERVAVQSMGADAECGKAIACLSACRVEAPVVCAERTMKTWRVCRSPSRI
jgi:hypothetical protein